MFNFEISDEVEQKLQNKHCVELEEIIQCFINHSGPYLRDNREKHQTIPPTEWFIGETDQRRRLKVVFIQKKDKIVIKTAYEPNPIEERIYGELRQ